MNEPPDAGGPLRVKLCCKAEVRRGIRDGAKPVEIWARVDPVKREIVWSRNVAVSAGMLDITVARRAVISWGSGERTWRFSGPQAEKISGDPTKIPEEAVFQLAEALLSHFGAEVAVDPGLATRSSSSCLPGTIELPDVLAAQPPGLAALASPNRRRELSPVSSLLSPEDVAAYLRERFGLVVEGFDQPDVPLQVLRDFARAVDDALTEYPMIDLRKVSLQDLTKRNWTDNVSAICVGRENLGSTRDDPDLHAAEIVLCSTWAKDPVLYKELSEESEGTRHHPPGFAQEPFYSVILHELGHALDLTGSQRARDLGVAALKAMHEASSERNSAFRFWALRQMSAYSLNRALTKIDIAEALAQAFVDVFLNGPGASKTSKALHAILVAEAKRRPKRGPRRPPVKDSVEEAIADVISRLASERRLSNREIATLTGMSRRAIDDLLDKRAAMGIDEADAIASCLDVDLVAVLNEAQRRVPTGEPSNRRGGLSPALP